jgi:uncharacterized membrane protein YdjX (TVP38/TMEM64 family)
MPLKWYPAVAAAVFALFLALFLIARAWNVPVLADPTPQLRQAGVPAAFLGVGLLLVDALLPVPSSLVMIAHGAAFGVALGTLLSVIGSMGAALVGFGLGRRGGPLLDRLISPRERSTADRLLEHWGVLAIVLTRPVPLLAETVAVLAGASSLGWGRVTLAALAGTLPAAVIYALTGAAVAAFGSRALVLAAAVAVAACAWLVDRHLAPRLIRNCPRALAETSSGTV